MLGAYMVGSDRVVKLYDDDDDDDDDDDTSRGQRQRKAAQIQPDPSIALRRYRKVLV